MPKAWLALVVFALIAPGTAGAADKAWPESGRYTFDGWDGPSLGVAFGVPAGSGAKTPILIVVPGARRNAATYRDEWLDLARRHGFIVLALEATHERFPTEHEYNAGSVLAADGSPRPAGLRLFSAIEPLFDDFRRRFGSRRKTYSIYGHSAGGGFVHRFVLFNPGARFDRAVAANPAFFAMPDERVDYPFGLAGAFLAPDSLKRWLAADLVVMLGDQDTGPRTKPLSNGPLARLQGPSVFARGLGFYKAGLEAATRLEAEFQWKLEVVQDVGHSNPLMAPHAVKYLFPD